MTASPALIITHNVADSRFETTVDGQVAVADYETADGVMALTHTVVPRALEGRGIAAQLVAAALNHARANGLKVNPVCSYVAAYMLRHPETQNLRAP